MLLWGFSRASGEIGRHVRFRSVWGNPWRFESSLAHNKKRPLRSALCIPDKSGYAVASDL